MVGRSLPLLVCCAVAGLHPRDAAALTSGTSRTYVLPSEAADGANRLPAYEYLDLAAPLGMGGALTFEAGGWGRLELADETGDGPSDGELQYGHLSWRGAVGNRFVRLGRLEATGGVAVAERLDGVAAGGDLRGGFSASAYVGVPVETDRGGRDGDLLYGGRLSRRVSGIAEIGLSYLRERDDGEEAREEQGVDVLLQPHRAVTLDGRSVYSPDASTWTEHHYRARFLPRPALSLAAEYQDVDYASLFRSASVGAFLPASLPAEEGMRLLGAEAAYELTPAVTAAVTWKGYAYDVAGDARAAGGRLGYAAGAWGAGLAYTRVRGDAARLRYHEYRGYAVRRAGRADLALDLAALRYDEAIDGRDDAVTATLAAGYALRPNLRVAADATYVTDPVYRRDVRGMLKLVYGFAFAAPKP